MRRIGYRELLVYRSIKFLTSCFCAAHITAVAAEPATTDRRQQIWFVMRGLEENWHGVNGLQGWEKLFFRPEAAWPKSMTGVQVIGIGTTVMSKLSDDQLVKVVARLKQEHVALGSEMLAQAFLEDVPTCGQNVEGYAPRGAHSAIAARVKKAGGTVQYLSMDEPLYFGHSYNGAHACHSTIENISERVATNIREYQKEFPDVVVGDIEPLPALSDEPAWEADYSGWIEAFKHAVGRPLAYTQIDIDWNHRGWQQSLQAATAFLRSHGIPFGIIYNAATRPGQSNEEWLASARENFITIEDRMHIVPRQAIFESWNGCRSARSRTRLAQERTIW